MDPAKMKVVDLRSELGALGLDTKGNKPALVERLKKALEEKTGKGLPDTTILDTTTEGDDEDTPRRPGPAARTRRRSSSSRVTATPAKHARRESPEPIEEVKDEGSERYSPQPDSDSNSMPEPVRQKSTTREKTPEKESSPEREKSPVKEDTPTKTKVPEKKSEGSEIYSIDDEGSESPVEEKEVEEDKQDKEESKETSGDSEDKKDDSKADEPAVKMEVEEDKGEERQHRERELTEEEEWEQLNERLKIKEQERIEREKQQAEEDAKKLENLSNDPVKLNRLKRKLEKKQRWNNFYRAVEVTNEVLTPPTEEDYKINKGKKEVVETKVLEPEIDENKIALSWYDSDLNQYLEEDLSGAVPLTDGAFAYAWAGARATHGVTAGRVCYEVRVGSVITTTENTEKDQLSSGLRVGWSTEDSSLHLGESELSWGYETTGKAVNNGEFKEYGKQLNEKDVVGAYLDLESNPCKIFYTLNGTELGTAFEFDKSALGGKTLFPHVLTKNQCYRINFGYDRYNMITKTKIARKRIEIPVEQVLEEKRAREAELQRQKEEKERKEKERKEREKQEREERSRKKKEERERLEKERKEKEAQEKRDKGEEVPPEQEKDKEAEKNAEKTAADKDAADAAKPQENGEKSNEDKVVEVKEEPMETDQPAPAADPTAPPAPPAEDKDKEVKEEPEGDVVEVTEEQVLQGHVLDKRIQFVIRYTVDEELDGTEACLVPGYVLISLAQLVPGPRAPATIAEAEVLLMVGMPGSGKTHWAKQHCAAHPQRRYNLLSTGALFDKMKVDCKPFKASYEGRWDAFVSKCAKCVLKLLEMARGRKRNFILDQTNVYPSAQRRKLRDFDGYRRIAVVIATDEETYKERCKRREEADGKEVPDPAIMDMKANFTLPEKCTYIDEVLFPELNEEEAKAAVEAFHKEAKAAGVVKEKERRERSAGRDQPPNKRARDDKRHGRDDRDRSRDFRDRGGAAVEAAAGAGPAGAGPAAAAGVGEAARAGAPETTGPGTRVRPDGSSAGDRRNEVVTSATVTATTSAADEAAGARAGQGAGTGAPAGAGPVALTVGSTVAPTAGPTVGPPAATAARSAATTGPPGACPEETRTRGPRRAPVRASAADNKAAPGPGSAAGRWRRTTAVEAGGAAAAAAAPTPTSRAPRPAPSLRRTDSRIKASKINRVGTSGPAVGADGGATGTKTKRDGAAGTTGATGTRARTLRGATSHKARPLKRARINNNKHQASSSNNSGLPTTPRNSGISGSSGNSNSSNRAGPGTGSKAKVRHPPRRKLNKHGHNIIRTTARTLQQVALRALSPALIRNDPKRHTGAGAPSVQGNHYTAPRFNNT